MFNGYYESKFYYYLCNSCYYTSIFGIYGLIVEVILAQEISRDNNYIMVRTGYQNLGSVYVVN